MHKSFNAGLILSVVRTVLGLVIFSMLWALWGFAVSGYSLAFAMVVWCVLMGPLFFLGLLAFRHPFVGRSVYRVDLKRFPVLLKGYFKNIIQHPGPNPELLVMPSRDVSLIWLQSPWGRRQRIYVSSAWLEQGYHELVSQFTQTWIEISEVKPFDRFLRTLQWSFWCACLLPLDLALHLLDLCFSFFGFRNMPRAAFWAQRACWQLKHIWFGGPRREESDQVMFDIARSARGNFHTPSALESLLWGVWSKHAQQGAHPSWAILMDANAFFGSTHGRG